AHNVLTDHHHRGYVKALRYLFMSYIVDRKEPPPTLHVDFLMENTYNVDSAVKHHAKYLFEQKRKGNKNLDFLATFDKARYANFMKQPLPDYDYLFQNFLFGEYDGTD